MVKAQHNNAFDRSFTDAVLWANLLIFFCKVVVSCDFANALLGKMPLAIGYDSLVWSAFISR